MNIRQQIEELAKTPTEHRRGDWSHYPCPVCGGKRNHRWPPLGVSDSGGYRCLRCGLRGSLTSLRRTRPTDPALDTGLVLDASRTCRFMSDRVCRDYMRERGIGEKTGWLYGRGKQAGCPVFPAYDLEGICRYAQYRQRRGKYRTLEGGSKAVADCWCYLVDGYDTEELWITEGPIDAHAVRQRLKLAATPAWGMLVARNKDFLTSVAICPSSRIVLVFDAEELAEVNALWAARCLKYEYGVPAEVLRWPTLDGQDPADLGRLDDLEQLLTMERWQI